MLVTLLVAALMSVEFGLIFATVSKDIKTPYTLVKSGLLHGRRPSRQDADERGGADRRSAPPTTEGSAGGLCGP
ncbi:MAG: hypothetical protein PVH40_10355, partial [Gemmatimonadales bacterium]